MGRPAKELTEKQRAELETLAPFLTMDQIADYFGIHRNTFSAMVERDEDIRVRYKRGRAKVVSDISNSLIMKAREGDNACMFFYLKTQAGWRETDRVEHVGAGGGSIKIERVIVDSALPDRDAEEV